MMIKIVFIDSIEDVVMRFHSNNIFRIGDIIDINSFIEIHPRYFDFHKKVNTDDFFNDVYDYIVIDAIIVADDENNYHQTLFVKEHKETIIIEVDAVKTKSGEFKDLKIDLFKDQLPNIPRKGDILNYERFLPHLESQYKEFEIQLLKVKYVLFDKNDIIRIYCKQFV